MAHSCVVKVKRRGVSFGRIFLGRIEEVKEFPLLKAAGEPAAFDFAI